MKLTADLDIFDKFKDDEMKEHSTIGTHLSFAFAIFSINIFCIFLYRVIRPNVFRDLNLEPKTVDNSQLINASITCKINIPCIFLRLNSYDSITNQNALNTTATLRRISKNGHVIGSYEQRPSGDFFAQLNQNVENGETCLVQGKILVRPVPGSFSIALEQNANLMMFLNSIYSSNRYDLSHKITRIRFGPKIPYTKSTLESFKSKSLSGAPKLSIYNLLITPVTFVKNGEQKSIGYEYHVTHSSIRYANGFNNLPGIYFYYKFTPYTIMINAETRSIIRFLASCAGLISGIFAILSFTDIIANKKQIQAESNKNEPKESSVSK